MNKGLKMVSLWTTIGMFLVLIMGALVTKTGSGEGCGNSWPLCHGRFAPLANMESLIEYSHRAVSGAVGILVLIQSIWAWVKIGHIRGVKLFAFSTFFFTFAQALLGAAAVIWSQSSAVLALHFGISLAAFATCLLLTILVYQANKDVTLQSIEVSTGTRNAIWGISIYSYIVVYVGAYVRHTGSGLGCLDWPTCNGRWVPELTGSAGIQFTHRLAAFLFLVLIIWLFLVVRSKYRNQTDLYYGTMLALVLTIMQVISGGIVVLTGLSLFPSLLHNMIISFLFGILAYLCFQTVNPRESRTQ